MTCMHARIIESKWNKSHRGLVGWLFGWLVVCLCGWLVGWVVGWRKRVKVKCGLTKFILVECNNNGLGQANEQLIKSK